jgi:hypothetical protein
MVSYQNVPHFDDCDREDFLAWRELLLSHRDTHHPQTVQLLCQNVSGEQIGGNGEVEGVDDDDDNEADDAEAVVPAVIGPDEGANLRNQAAKGHVRLFLGPTQRCQLLHLPGEVEVWADLHAQYEHVARRTRPSVAAAVRLVQAKGRRNYSGYVQSFRCSLPAAKSGGDGSCASGSTPAFGPTVEG